MKSQPGESSSRAAEQHVRIASSDANALTGDAQRTDLRDVIDAPAIHLLMEDFYALTGIPVSITGVDGDALIEAGAQEVCTRFNRSKCETRKICLESRCRIAAGLKRGESAPSRCGHHLWNAATPVIIGGRHLGNLFCGQFTLEEEPACDEELRRHARQFGFPEDAYLASVKKAPRLTRDKVQAAMRFLTKLGHMLSTLGLKNLDLARSVAEREALARSLEHAGERLNRAQEIAHLGSWELDLVGGRLTWSDEVYRIFGLEPQQFRATYEAFLDMVHPEDRATVDAAYSSSLRDGAAYEITHRIIRNGGELRWVHEKCEHFRNDSGLIVRSAGMVQDITARKQAEEALRRSEAMYRAIARNLPESAVFVIDSELRCVLAEGSLAPIVGHGKSSLEGRSIHDVLSPLEAEVIGDRLRRAFSGEQASYDTEFRGKSVWVTYVPLRDDDGCARAAMVLVHDVTERKRVEEHLRQAQKLESVGLLAGGIAHDFNNLLVGVLGNASMAQDLEPEDSPAAEYLRRVIQSGEQAANLTRQLLAYAGKGRFVLEPVNLSAVASENMPLVQASISKKVSVRMQAAARLPRVEADPSQMQQIFMNLVLNAAEAIGDAEGEITISTSEIHLDAAAVAELDVWPVKPGRHVVLEVRDTGSGMDAATKARIFDPFFSTKMTGRGLGLAAVAGIVRVLKGAIDVVSVPGAGSRFRVILPGMPQPHQTEATQVYVAPEDGRRGVVLVVDDETIVCDLATRCLEHCGYSVLAAASGESAVNLARAEAGRIEVVLLDVGLPGMRGEETLSRLLAIKPGLRVVVSSGYSELESRRLFEGIKISGFLQKPYTIHQLVSEVDHALADIRTGGSTRRAAAT